MDADSRTTALLGERLAGIERQVRAISVAAAPTVLRADRLVLRGESGNAMRMGAC